MKHTSYHLPRRGQYELFTFNGVTQCYDDPGFDWVPARPEMFVWLRNQSGVRPMDSQPTRSTTCLSLTLHLQCATRS